MGNMLTPFSKWKLLVRECWNLICVYIDNFFFIKKTVVGVTEFNKSPEQCNDVFLIAKDHCATNPCLHGGTCIDTRGWFNCSCTDRYGGPRCEFSKCETHCFKKLSDSTLTLYAAYMKCPYLSSLSIFSRVKIWKCLEIIYIKSIILLLLQFESVLFFFSLCLSKLGSKW